MEIMKANVVTFSTKLFLFVHSQSRSFSCSKTTIATLFRHQTVHTITRVAAKHKNNSIFASFSLLLEFIGVDRYTAPLSPRESFPQFRYQIDYCEYLTQ